MKRFAVLSVGVVMFVLALGAVRWAVAQAEGRHHSGMGGPGQQGERMLAMLDNDRAKAALGLTDDQSTRLRQIIVDTQKATIKTKADLAVRRIELRELLKADNPDRDAVMKKVGEVSDLSGQLMQQHVQALLSAKTILTPEQQKKLRQFRASQREGWGRPGMQGQGRPPMAPRPSNDPPVQ